jgi:hypothetical protein
MRGVQTIIFLHFGIAEGIYQRVLTLLLSFPALLSLAARTLISNQG